MINRSWENKLTSKEIILSEISKDNYLSIFQEMDKIPSSYETKDQVMVENDANHHIGEYS